MPVSSSAYYVDISDTSTFGGPTIAKAVVISAGDIEMRDSGLPENAEDINALLMFFKSCGIGTGLSKRLARNFVVDHNICTVKMLKRKNELTPLHLKSILVDFGLDEVEYGSICDNLKL